MFFVPKAMENWNKKKSSVMKQTSLGHFFSFFIIDESPFGPGACPQHHALVPPTRNYYVNSTKVETSLNFVMYHIFWPQLYLW